MDTNTPHRDNYEETRKYFDASAVNRQGFYDNQGGALKHSNHVLKIRKKIEKIFETIGTKKNLDVGCGKGDFTISLAQRYPAFDFTGIDFSSEMIKVAHSDAAELGLKNITFDTGNVLSLQYADRSFGTVFCINTLHHIQTEDYRKAFSELARVSDENVIVEIKNSENAYYKYVRTGFGKYNPNIGDNVLVYPTTVSSATEYMRGLGFDLAAKKPFWHFTFLSPFIVLHFKRRNV